MLMSIAAAMMVPPPLEGDERSAILYTLRSTLDGLLAGDDVRGAFLPEAMFPIVDVRDGDAKTDVRTLDQMMETDWKAADYHEPFGIPTVLQDGALAQVWVPYSFWADGKKLHCGVDNVTMMRIEGEWRIAQFGFTMTSLDECEALGAPAEADPQSGLTE